MNAKSQYLEMHLFSEIHCSATNDPASLKAYQQEPPVSDHKLQVTCLIQIEMSNTHANEHLELSVVHKATCLQSSESESLARKLIKKWLTKSLTFENVLKETRHDVVTT